MVSRFEAFSEYIVELNRYIQKIKEVEMNKLGLHAKHTMCLYYLGKYPDGLTSTELTKLCSEDKAAVSRTLTQLENGGFVSRGLPEDKRAYRAVYNLTESGEEIVKRINERVKSVIIGAGTGLSDEQRGELYSSLELILNNLKNLPCLSRRKRSEIINL